MDNMRSVDFDAALLCLHRWIGSKVKATVNLYGQFFGCAMAGELRRVEFLPPDHTAISLVLDGSDGVYLDPADTETFIGREGSVELLEFRTAYGVFVVLEFASHR